MPNFVNLLESFPDLILVLDLQEQYTFVSARIRDLLGYGPAMRSRSVSPSSSSDTR